MAISRDKLYVQHAEQTHRFRGTPIPRGHFDERLEQCKAWLLLRMTKCACDLTLKGLEKVSRLFGARLEVCVDELAAEGKVVVGLQSDGQEIYRSAKAKGENVISIERARPRLHDCVVKEPVPEANDRCEAETKEAKHALCDLLSGGGAYVNRKQIGDILRVTPAVANRVISELLLERRIARLKQGADWYTEGTPNA